MPTINILHPEIADHLDYRWLERIIASLHHGVASKWAVLCVCFQDDPASLPSLDNQHKLFTNEGAGTMNMVRFFADMSHGQLDLSESKVFGWYRLSHPRSDYLGNVYPAPPGKLNRNGLLDAARAAAQFAGVDLSAFDGVVVSGYGSTDLCGWVGGMAALCDAYSLQPSLLGQEMGHGYGLNHARLDGSSADYQDPWDVMSTAAFPDRQAPDEHYGSIGPGLNACSMRSRGWLDETRVWTGPAGGFESTVTLRPLHRRDLHGNLAAQVGPYLVEFRVREGWDAAIPRAAVLVHRFEDNRSYLMPATNGSEDLAEGDRFEAGSSSYSLRPHACVSVLDIDEGNRTARVQLTWRPAQLLRELPPISGQVFGAVDVDGGGGVFVGGHFHPVPPWGPESALLRAFGQYLSSNITASVAAGTQFKRDLLREVVRQALALHASLEDVSHSPPGYGQKSQHLTD